MGGLRSGLGDTMQNMNPGAGGAAGGGNLESILQMMRGMGYGGPAGSTDNAAATPQRECTVE